MPNKEEYLDEVCKQIRFRAARKYLRQELDAHIEDKKEEYIKNAAPDAEAKAVASMGDATETGRALNAVHRPRTEWGVIACVLALTVAGFLTIWLSQMDDIYFSSGWQFSEQIWTHVFGICLAAAACFFNYTYIVRLRYVLYAAALAMVACYITWNQYMFSETTILFLVIDWPFQTPVITFATLLFMLGTLGFISKPGSRGAFSLLPSVGLGAVSIAAMTIIQASFYALLLAIVYLTALGVAVFRMHSNKLRRILYLLVPACVFAAVLILLIKSGLFLNLFLKLRIAGFGTNIGEDSNAYVVTGALKGSKLIGASPYYLARQSAGLGGSSTDFILTSVITRYGWLAAAGFIAAYGVLLFLLFTRGIRIAHTAGKVIALGISAFLLLRFVACVLTNVGIITGVSCGLPFVSFGRVDYIANSLLIGIFLSVWRRSTFMKDKSRVQIIGHTKEIDKTTTA
ncbi:MAG: permease prefix domain 1-containing protein [Burkholderiales bacterium]|jgi:cell division protein FtsW (lipid II flippase)